MKKCVIVFACLIPSVALANDVPQNLKASGEQLAW